MALPYQHRLKGHRAFDLLYQKGRKFHGPFLLLRLIEARPELLPPPQRLAPPSAWRCGVVVSSKVSKRAVRRNRIRRLLHRQLLEALAPASQRSLWLLLSVKPGSAERPGELLLGECRELLLKAGLTA
ncbi:MULTISPECIES: ribonuclease P protein component [unclassified Synechococcus]|uniref:ribonuclease P protein component n=1 Tax=unclassified Synechococcus TaxID=2626047 RepID=UPI0018CD61AE|nr:MULTISPECIES: ribonuclease P protein component [unclassified Synechococcus]MEA5422211.1 ribonuclease P protein component [Synechococcus sp. CCY9202]QPN65326.1 ribonuclease P protein component [Synechococcus sp. CBW1006]